MHNYVAPRGLERYTAVEPERLRHERGQERQLRLADSRCHLASRWRSWVMPSFTGPTEAKLQLSSAPATSPSHKPQHQALPMLASRATAHRLTD